MRGLLASPLGFLIGLSLGAFGGGGSILAVPALVYGAGQTPRNATSTSLILVGTAAIVGLGNHWRAGRVRVKTGVVFGLAGIGGSLGGSALNRHLDANLLLLGFSGLVLVAAWRMIVSCPTCTRIGEAAVTAAPNAAGSPVQLPSRAGTARALRVLATGTAVGFLTGLFGVGGGFVVVPALVLVMSLSMPEAVGTSLLVIAINSAVALCSRLTTTSIDWAVTLPFAVAAVAGVITGGRVADRLDPQRSLRWFASLLVAVGAYTALRSATGLT